MSVSPSVVTLGKFDGIHIGHTKLIEKTVDIATRYNLNSVVYTIVNTSTSRSISDVNEKESFLHTLGIDEIVYRNLDAGIKEMKPDAFVTEILCRELNARWVVVGENFRFGKNRCAGSTELKELCKKHNIETIIIDTVFSDNEKAVPVSSSLIREYIANGDMKKVSEFLGRPYTIRGIVGEGKQLGRKWGFPTINIDIDHKIYVPKNGVYASMVTIDSKKYKSITNVGKNPTIDNLDHARSETHILGENIECYGKTAVVEFLEFIRSEKTFENECELKNNITEDIRKVMRYFNTKEVDEK